MSSPETCLNANLKGQTQSMYAVLTECSTIFPFKVFVLITDEAVVILLVFQHFVAFILLHITCKMTSDVKNKSRILKETAYIHEYKNE